jgi:hypothetical protein
MALGLALPAAPGQEREKPSPRPSTEPVVRQVYPVRNRSPKDLANTLTRHFEAEASFRVVPDAGSNLLLLSGTKAALEDVLQVLRQIDSPPRNVRVEVLSVELTAKPGVEGGGDAKPLDLAELSGNVRDVRAKVRELQQKGIISVKTAELTVMAGQSARTQVAENKPFVTGVTGGFGGGRGGFGGGGAGGGATPTMRSISYRNVGSSVQVTPVIGADGQMLLDLDVEDSAPRAAEGGVTVGSDDKGTAISATEFVVFSLETRVKVRPGQFVLAEGTKTGAKSGQAQRIVLVTASTDEGTSKDSK